MNLQTKAGGGLDDLVARLRLLASGDEPLPPERNLSQQLGVNRYLLRQGLQILRDNGEIEPTKARAAPGRSLKKLSIVQNTSPVEVWEIRLSMEPQIARAAALRATPREMQVIREAHDMASPDVFDLEKDIEFHRRIAVSSHNNLWVVVIDLLTDLTREESFKMQLPPFTSVTGYDHHEEILAAITARDATGAEKAMYAHLSAIQRWVMGMPSRTE